MKVHILALLFAILFISAHAAETPNDDDDDDEDITTLTFLVQYQPEPDNDYINIGVTVEAGDSSLKKAIERVTSIVNQIEDIAETFCKENPVEDADCEQIIEVDDFEIEAKYSQKRKELLFENFVVSHDITIRVDNTEQIGQLGDKLLKTPQTKIDSFDWESDEQDDDQEEAIEAGKEKAEQLCYHLGMKLHRIVSVQDVEQQQEEDNGDEDGEDDEDDDDDGPLVYRFEVECIKDAQTAEKKAKQQQQEDRKQAEEKEKQKKKEREQDLVREEKKKQQEQQKPKSAKKEKQAGAAGEKPSKKKAASTK